MTQMLFPGVRFQPVDLSQLRETHADDPALQRAFSELEQLWQIAKLAEQVLEAQKLYFRSRTQEHLQASKALEQELRKQLQAVGRG